MSEVVLCSPVNIYCNIISNFLVIFLNLIREFYCAFPCLACAWTSRPVGKRGGEGAANHTSIPTFTYSQLEVNSGKLPMLTVVIPLR